MNIPVSELLYVKDIREPGDFKNFLHDFVRVGYFHTAFGVHGFMRGQKHTQPGGRDVIQFAEIQGQGAG